MLCPCCNICWCRSLLCSCTSWFSERKKKRLTSESRKILRKNKFCEDASCVHAHVCICLSMPVLCIRMYVETRGHPQVPSSAIGTLCSETPIKKSSMAGQWAQGYFCHYLPRAGVINSWLHIQVSHMSSEDEFMLASISHESHLLSPYRQ